ncbi:MAG: VanZ family protein [Lachnospiraceae bacterium]|nr:VanZ family protein [Lachnospiraceae bacterium]
MKQRRIYLILAVMWMALIFYMSSRDAAESTEDSLAVGRIICEILDPEFHLLEEPQQMTRMRAADHLVRKCAHAAEYAVLGFLLFMTLKKYRVRRCALPALLLTACYAAGDEIHQYFVPGRSCQAGDVLIDSAGALAAIIVTVLVSGYSEGRVS